MGIKNLWSLNVDEAILSEKIGKELGKEYQIFFPVNSQLKDIDLIIYNLKTQKTKSIQVKGSRTSASLLQLIHNSFDKISNQAKLWTYPFLQLIRLIFIKKLFKVIGQI